MDKKSFILYNDLQELVNELPNEVAGKLFKHILNYVNGIDEDPDDILIKAAFIPIKNQLKRDLEHWKSVVDKRSKAGKASANKRQQVLTGVDKCASVLTDTDTVTVNDTVTVTVTDNVNDNGTVIKSKDTSGVYLKFDHLSITNNQYDKLCELYQKSDVDDILDRIRNYRKNTSYKDLYLTACNWLKKDGKKPLQHKEEIPTAMTPAEMFKRGIKDFG